MKASKHTVLCVDDEKNILCSLKRLLHREAYRLLTADHGARGLEIMRAEEVQLVVCDQRMPEMSGIEFLTRVREEFPEVVRIILTGYTDVDTITDSVNRGHIYKFLLKPWDENELRMEIRKALEQFDLRQTNRRLHEQVVRQNEELRRVNLNLETRVAERAREIELQYQALEVFRTIMQDLPVPVIGVTLDGMVVLHNRRALKLAGGREGVGIGRRISDCLPVDLAGDLRRMVADGVMVRTLPRCRLAGDLFDIDLFQLSGKFKGRGVMLAFRPAGDRGSGGEDATRPTPVTSAPTG